MPPLTSQYCLDLIDQNSDTVCLLPDSILGRLLSVLNEFESYPAILGESLFRCWLYSGSVQPPIPSHSLEPGSPYPALHGAGVPAPRSDLGNEPGRGRPGSSESWENEPGRGRPRLQGWMGVRIRLEPGCPHPGGLENEQDSPGLKLAPQTLVSSTHRKAGKSLWALFQAEALPRRQSLDLSGFPPANHPLTHHADKDAWAHLVRRIRSFCTCDGLIPVVFKMTGEAVPIPFKIEFAETSPVPGSIYDDSGKSIARWTVHIEQIQSILEISRVRVRLDVKVGELKHVFEGGSLALPVLLGIAKRRGRINDYRPVRVLVTGALRNGVVSVVDGLNAKQALAQRMGALFIAPGHGSDSVPCLADVDRAVKVIASILDRKGLLNLDVPGAYSELEDLGQSVSDGIVPLNIVEHQILRYENVFKKHPADHRAQEGLLKAGLLRAAVANHTGRPEDGRRLAHQAAGNALKKGLYRIYVSSTCHDMVSLVDMGWYEEAARMGQEVLKFMDPRRFKGDSKDRDFCELRLHGTLGSQVYLNMALSDARWKPISLEHIDKALVISRRIKNPPDICRNINYRVQWYALLEPERTKQAVDEARREFMFVPLSDKRISWGYLCRIRFLGAYRLWRNTGIVESGVDEWELPASGVGHESWLRATALKYRGALLCSQGKSPVSEIEPNFTQACTLLECGQNPLLRFIGVTAALQAGESLLPLDRKAARRFLVMAQAGFSSFKGVFQGPLDADVWLKRTQGLLAGKPAGRLPDPQAGFAC